MNTKNKQTVKKACNSACTNCNFGLQLAIMSILQENRHFPLLSGGV